jgi:hypothetical protein
MNILDEYEISKMTSHVVLLELDRCGYCKTFREKVWPIICNTIQSDSQLSDKVVTSTHVMYPGRGYEPPINIQSFAGIACQNFPALLVLGPGEDVPTFKINSSNLYPNRLLSRNVIIVNNSKVNILPLDWTINTLRTKYQNYTPSSSPQVSKLQPPNRAILKEYVHPNSTVRVKHSELSSV